MKKFLSVLLAALMIFSTVSFAAPTAVSTVDSVSETVVVEEAAEAVIATVAGTVSEWHDEKNGILLYNLDFDNIS